MSINKSEASFTEISSIDSLLGLVSPKYLPTVNGVELGVIGEISSQTGNFHTWVETKFGLLAIAGTLSAETAEERRIYCSIMIGSIGVASKAMYEPDPCLIIEALNDYLSLQKPMECTLSLAVAAWDSDSELFSIAKVGTSDICYIKNNKTVNLDVETPQIGLGLEIAEPPEVVKLGIHDCLIVSANSGTRIERLESIGLHRLQVTDIADSLESNKTLASGLILKRVIDLE